MTRFAAFDSERGQYVLEYDMAQSISWSGAGPVNSFIHGYSGAKHPASFDVSAVSMAANWNYAAMLNTKLPDWAGLANGAYDSLITAFYNSWPVNVRGWVTCNHEPENDGGDPATWCAGIARYIRVAAEVIRERQLNVAVGGVLMGFSWTTTRWQSYKWWEQVAAVDLPQTFFGIDQYGKCLPTTPVTGEDIWTPLETVFAQAGDYGITRFAVFEAALDRRQKNKSANIIGTDETIALWLPNFAAGMAAIPGMEAVCHFHATTGPASQYAQLKGVSVPIWAYVCQGSADGY